jgi:hypothetical protein
MGLSTALRSLALLDVQSSTPAGHSVATPCIQAHLHLLATETREKCGLVNWVDIVDTGGRIRVRFFRPRCPRCP